MKCNPVWRTTICLLPFLAAMMVADPVSARQADSTIDPPAKQEQAGKKPNQDQPVAGQGEKRQTSDKPEQGKKQDRQRRQMNPQDATPQQRMQRLVQMLRQMDANQNGVLEKSEMPERMLARWDKLDTDANGQLDSGEVAAMLRQIVQRSGQTPRDGMPGTSQMKPGDGQPPGANSERKRRVNKKQPTPRPPDQQEVPETGSVEPIRPDKKSG